MSASEKITSTFTVQSKLEIDRLDLIERVRVLHRMWIEERQMRAMWEGKFHQVKRENNMLRRREWLLRMRADG